MRLRTARRLSGAVMLTATSLWGCGSSTKRTPPAAPSRPAAAAPIAISSPGWPALLHRPSHFGASSSVGPESLRLRWRALGAPIVAGPVTTSQGTAYVAADDRVLHAIDVATGRDRWTFNGGGDYGSDLSTAPLVLSSGKILWPGPRHRLFALTRAGRLRWTLAGGADLLTPVLDRRADLLVVADETGRISGYLMSSGNRAPRRVWSTPLASGSYGNPVVAADGTIYETAGDCLFALSSSGKVRWTVTTPEQVEVSPAVAVNGIVVFGSNDRYQYGVDPDGHYAGRRRSATSPIPPRWRCPAAASCSATTTAR